MKTSMHLKVAVLIAHVALCTAMVIDLAQSDSGRSGACVPVYHPDHR